MQNRRIILIGGLSFIATGVLYPAVFTFLAVRFGYPGVLDGQASDVLPKLLAGGWAFRAAWAVYGLLPLLLLPAAAGAFEALRGRFEGGMRLAHQLASLSAFALMLGLLRWSSLHWELAKLFEHADGPQRELIGTLFLGFNTYLGNYLGEFLGEGFMHAFLLLTAVGMLKSGSFPKWMTSTGIAVSILSLIGVFRNVSALAESVQDLINMGMVFPIWLVILGIGLFRHAGKDGNAPL